MKKIFIYLICALSFLSGLAQTGNDTTKYSWYQFTYGNKFNRMWGKEVVDIPTDTTFSKYGVARKGTTLYLGNGILWTALSAANYADGIVTGCVVSYVSNLTYRVSSPCVYNINGTQYSLGSTTDVTIPDGTASAGEFRTDAIVVTTSSTATSVTGDNSIAGVGESAQPDPDTQFLLSYVRIDEANTTPTGVSQTIIRDEGSGGEWTISKTLTSTDNYATNPFHLTISQRITGANSNQYMQWIAPAVQSKATFNTLLLYIRNNSAFANVRNLTATLRNGNATQVGNAINLTAYGYVKNLTGSYQTIAIPMSAFAGADAFDRIRITNTQVGGTVDVQIDYVQLQSGITTGPPAAAKQVFFPTVAALRAYAGTTDIQATTQGYYTVNDGGGASYYWDGTSTAVDDGGLTIKLTAVATGRFKLKYDNVVHLKWFGAKADSTTDARAALKAAISAMTAIPLEAVGTNHGYGTVIIDRGKFYISDSIVIRETVNLIGAGAGSYPYQESQLKFNGVHGGLFFLMRNSGTGGRNCTVQNIYLISNLTDYHQTWHGLFSNTVIHGENIAVTNFSGDGIIVDTRDSGNANNSSFIHCHADNNRRYGFSFWGNDANNLNLIGLDANTNGGSNFHDQSFLGNQYYGLHSSYAGIRAANNLSSVHIGSTIYTAWQPNTNIQPGVTSGWENYWIENSNLPLGYTTTWSADSSYFDASAFWGMGAASSNNIYGGYTEGGQLAVALATFGKWDGGDNGTGMINSSMVWVRAVEGQFTSASNIQVKDYTETGNVISMTNSNGFQNHWVGVGLMNWDINRSDTSAYFGTNNDLEPKLRAYIGNRIGQISEFGRDTVRSGAMTWGIGGFYAPDWNGNYISGRKRKVIYGTTLPTGSQFYYAVGDKMIYTGGGIDTIEARVTTAGRPGTWEWVLSSGSYPYVFTTPTEGQIVAFDASLNLVNVDLGDIGDVTTSQLADTAAAIRADFPAGGSGWALSGTTTLTDNTTISIPSSKSLLFANAANYPDGVMYFAPSGNVIIGDRDNAVNQIQFQVDDPNNKINVVLGSAGVFRTSSLADTTNYIPESYVTKAYVDDHVANGGGGSSGLTIDATTITGGTTNYVLFQKSDGTVTENYNFHFNPGTGTLTTYQFSANGGNFLANGAGVQIAGGQYLQMSGGSTLKGYQQSFDFIRNYPGTSTAASVTIDNTTENAVPGTFHIIDFKLSGASKSFIDQSGALGIMNTTQPSGALTNGVYFYAQDVSSSAEAFVRDEANNSTQISPHNFTGIPEGKSNPLAWSFYSERDGKYINVDMYKLAELVEKLTGEKLIYTGDINNKPNATNK